MAITQDFTTRAKFKFDNTREGLETMLHRARREMVASGCRGVIFAIETGGHYWRNIAYFLEGRGIPYRESTDSTPSALVGDSRTKLNAITNCR